MKVLIILLFVGALGYSSCSSDELDTNTKDCDQETVVSAEEYQNAADDTLSITAANIIGDCLQVSFAASGCDGDTWKVALIDSEQIMESLPVQRNVRLSLDNKEDCTAVPIKTLAFDISNLQLEEYDEIYLNIRNYGDQLLYSY